jgi:maltose-binding protein MalE
MGIAPLRDRLITTAATVGIATLGLLAIGCGEDTTSNTAATVTGPLTIWHPDFKLETVEDLANGLTTDNTTVKAQKIETAYEWRLVNGIAADSAPDVAIIPNDYIPDHKDKFVTIPADYVKPDKDGNGAADTKTFFTETYIDLISAQLLNKDGTAIAFPGPVKELKLFINRKLFGEASDRWRQALSNKESEYEPIRKTLSSPIATWNDFAAASQRITQRNGNTIITSGAALGMAQNVEWAQDIYELMVMQQGGRVVDSTKLVALFQNYEKNADGRLIYPGKDALRYFNSYANPTNPNYSWNTDFTSARQAFLDGRVAMIFDYGEFEDVVTQKARDKVELEVANVPQVTADGEPVVFARYYAIGISKGSSQKSKAGVLAKLMASENASDLVRGLTNSYSPVKADLQPEQITRLAKAEPVFKRHHSDFDSIMSEMLDDVALRGQNADNAVDRAAERINQLLNKNE